MMPRRKPKSKSSRRMTPPEEVLEICPNYVTFDAMARKEARNRILHHLQERKGAFQEYLDVVIDSLNKLPIKYNNYVPSWKDNDDIINAALKETDIQIAKWDGVQIKQCKQSVKIDTYAKFEKKAKNHQDQTSWKVSGDHFFAPYIKKARKFLDKYCRCIINVEQPIRMEIFNYVSILFVYQLLNGTIKFHRTKAKSLIRHRTLVKSHEIHIEFEQLHSSLNIRKMIQNAKQERKEKDGKNNIIAKDFYDCLLRFTRKQVNKQKKKVFKSLGLVFNNDNDLICDNKPKGSKNKKKNIKSTKSTKKQNKIQTNAKAKAKAKQKDIYLQIMNDDDDDVDIQNNNFDDNNCNSDDIDKNISDNNSTTSSTISAECNNDLFYSKSNSNKKANRDRIFQKTSSLNINNIQRDQHRMNKKHENDRYFNDRRNEYHNNNNNSLPPITDHNYYNLDQGSIHNISVYSLRDNDYQRHMSMNMNVKSDNDCCCDNNDNSNNNGSNDYLLNDDATASTISSPSVSYYNNNNNNSNNISKRTKITQLEQQQQYFRDEIRKMRMKLFRLSQAQQHNHHRIPQMPPHLPPHLPPHVPQMQQIPQIPNMPHIPNMPNISPIIPRKSHQTVTPYIDDDNNSNNNDNNDNNHNNNNNKTESMFPDINNDVIMNKPSSSFMPLPFNDNSPQPPLPPWLNNNQSMDTFFPSGSATPQLSSRFVNMSSLPNATPPMVRQTSNTSYF